MTRKEFLELWKTKREAGLREAYKDDPHGAACLAASFAAVEEEGLKLWRKHRSSLSRSTAEELLKSWEKS